MKTPEWLSALAAFTPTERRMLAMILALALLGLATLVWHRHHVAELEKSQPPSEAPARDARGR